MIIQAGARAHGCLLLFVKPYQMEICVRCMCQWFNLMCAHTGVINGCARNVLEIKISISYLLEQKMISKRKKKWYQTKQNKWITATVAAAAAAATALRFTLTVVNDTVCVVQINKRNPARPPNTVVCLFLRFCEKFSHSLSLSLFLFLSLFPISFKEKEILRTGKRAHAHIHKQIVKRFVKHDFPYIATWHYCLLVFFHFSAVHNRCVRVCVYVCLSAMLEKSLHIENETHSLTLSLPLSVCEAKQAPIWTKYCKIDWFFHMNTRRNKHWESLSE